MPTLQHNLITALRNRMAGWVDAIGGKFADLLGAGIEGFNDPLSFAMRNALLSTADPMMPTEIEIGAIPAAQIDQVLDFAEYRLLVTAMQNYVDVDFTIGARTEHADQLRKGLQAAIDKKLSVLQGMYGYGGAGVSSGSAFGGLTAGSIDLAFQEKAA